VADVILLVYIANTYAHWQSPIDQEWWSFGYLDIMGILMDWNRNWIGTSISEVWLYSILVFLGSVLIFSDYNLYTDIKNVLIGKYEGGSINKVTSPLIV
jgi:hypothetical protein